MKISLYKICKLSLLFLLAGALETAQAQYSGSMLCNPRNGNHNDLQIEGNLHFIDSVKWDFGDGTITTVPLGVPVQQFDPGNSNPVTHTYAAAGQYSVTANVYGHEPNLSPHQYTVSRTITSYDLAPYLVDQEQCGLTATITVVNDSVNAYTFIGGSSGSPIYPCTYKIYRISDSSHVPLQFGGQSTNGGFVSQTGSPTPGFFPNVRVSINTNTGGFNVPGTYKFEYFIKKYSATGICYDSTSVFFQIAYAANCHAAFTMFEDSAHAGSWFAYNTSTGNNLSYEWDFGDGNSSNQPYPFHTYAVPGHYDICLTITGDSCYDQHCDTSSVHRFSAAGMSSFNVLPPVGMAEQVVTNGFNTFPNPFGDLLTVSFISGETKQLALTICDVSGRKLLTDNKPVLKGENTFLLNTAELAKGAYLLSLRDENGRLLKISTILKQ